MRNPLAFESFADWLNEQPPKKRYRYLDIHACAICQYLKTLGIKATAGANDWAPYGSVRNRHEICPEGVVSDSPWTYGAAAARAVACMKGN
jgi:hypothetical protein